MSRYGPYKATCGECGDSFESGDFMGDSAVQRWLREHKEQHRIAKLPPDERKAATLGRLQALAASWSSHNPDSPPT